MLLMDTRVVTYEGSLIEKCNFDNIRDLSADYSRSLVAMSTITVYRNDKTEFVIEITPAANSDKKLYSKLKSLWQSEVINKSR